MRPVNSDRMTFEQTILVPDFFMPAQFVAMHRPLAHNPEKRLIFAILDDAIKCFQHKGSKIPKRARLYWDAYDWIFEGGGPLSFVIVCEFLDIDADYLREKLRTWDGHLPRRSPVGGIQARPCPATRRRPAA